MPQPAMSHPHMQQPHLQHPAMSHPHMQQQAMAQQQYAQHPAPGRLEVKTGFFFLAWMLHFVKPNVEINGQRHKPNWGRFTIDLYPGQYHLHVSFPWVFGDKTGPAQTPVNIYAGHVTFVSYEAPLFLLSPGTIRTRPPQPIPGLPPAPPPGY